MKIRAAALLKPEMDSRSLEGFQSPDVELKTADAGQVDNLDAALVFGGDGTVHHFLPSLHPAKVPVLVVPRGTGNDFAHALNIHSERDALRAWKHFCVRGNNVREIDLGVIRKERQEILFCCVAGAGLDADANARANRLPSWLRSSAGYLAAAVQALAAWRNVGIEVTCSAKTRRTPAMLVAVGNAHRYGGGIKIVPRAQVDDGLLDVCLVGNISRLKVFFCLPMIYFGRHTRLREVEYFQTRQLRVETSPPIELYADGEPVCLTPVEIGLLPGALKVIVPPEGC